MEPKRYAREQARRIFAKAITQGRTTPTQHFAEELAKARATTQDVENVARTGRVYREPEPSTTGAGWNYRIEGTDLDGHRLQVVFEIVAENQVKLITVFNGREEMG